MVEGKTHQRPGLRQSSRGRKQVRVPGSAGSPRAGAAGDSADKIFTGTLERAEPEWSPVHKERQAEVVADRGVCGDSREGECWKLVTPAMGGQLLLHLQICSCVQAGGPERG